MHSQQRTSIGRRTWWLKTMFERTKGSFGFQSNVFGDFKWVEKSSENRIDWTLLRRTKWAINIWEKLKATKRVKITFNHSQNWRKVGVEAENVQNFRYLITFVTRLNKTLKKDELASDQANSSKKGCNQCDEIWWIDWKSDFSLFISSIQNLDERKYSFNYSWTLIMINEPSRLYF